MHLRNYGTGFGALTIILVLLASGPAVAEVSANAGWVSEYIFRGVPQKTSSASAGLDYEEGGFYIGTWGADVGDGLEIDGYLGYTYEAEEFSLGIGGTGYFYTSEFDDTYKELNLSIGFSNFSVDVAIGEYDNFTGPTLDYTHAAATLEYEGFYGTVANFSQDFKGTYVDLGYGFSVADEIDLTISVIFADKDLALNENPDTGLPQDDHTFVLGISKSFSFKE